MRAPKLAVDRSHTIAAKKSPWLQGDVWDFCMVSSGAERNYKSRSVPIDRFRHQGTVDAEHTVAWPTRAHDCWL